MTEEIEARFSAEHFAREGEAAFARASQSIDVAYNAVLGLRAVLQLTEVEGSRSLSRETVSRLTHSSMRAMPVLAQWLQDFVPIERISLGVTAAAMLTELFGEPSPDVMATRSLDLVLDQTDHVALLAAEMDVIVRRHSIYTSVTYALTAGVENLALRGTVRDGGGNASDNNITVNSADNVITGAAGYEVLTGGGGNDAFVFLFGAGVDFIIDFVGGAGISDAIYAPATMFSNFSDILAHVSQVGTDTVIGNGLGDTLVLQNVQLTTLSPDDFVLF